MALFRTQIEETTRGTGQNSGALEGKGLLQSAEEWNARNRELAFAINSLIKSHAQIRAGRALDVGCMAGELTDRYGEGLHALWWGIDPDVESDRISPGGARLMHGFADKLAFDDAFFDCITFANVYEHIPPTIRPRTLAELHRVLAPGGVVVGQIPNPYFPIESHSRLPFLGCLPRWAQRVYWPLTPTGWDFDVTNYFAVSIGSLKKKAEESGFETLAIIPFNYSNDAIPKSVRWAADLHRRLGIVPWAWQFVFRKN